ncbi:predicted protein [Sclerotinia sclerotiorum 1980 UF-70]|uniref:Uncharacterized protein n=1 Tax=Sclerotinia sclerotiorum (strain ATCC 18683 / 1980 / Ss-1) TaxID=665079 RepID=A7ER86_SCLS1|nr:predicted protein [Sclerotinia sclerotiorum 1980 UF-70]EDN91978.1 predicted protein [Sclerotinia sclerotiorum 1980 UF-70]
MCQRGLGPSMTPRKPSEKEMLPFPPEQTHGCHPDVHIQLDDPQICLRYVKGHPDSSKKRPPCRVLESRKLGNPISDKNPISITAKPHEANQGLNPRERVLIRKRGVVLKAEEAGWTVASYTSKAVIANFHQ